MPKTSYLYYVEAGVTTKDGVRTTTTKASHRSRRSFGQHVAHLKRMVAFGSSITLDFIRVYRVDLPATNKEVMERTCVAVWDKSIVSGKWRPCILYPTDTRTGRIAHEGQVITYSRNGIPYEPAKR
jgi:hypothetical protein